MIESYYVVCCSECRRFFAMQGIKSNYKMCPACGRKVKWKNLHKRRQISIEKAKEVADYLNDQKAMPDGLSVKELLRRFKEGDKSSSY